MEPFSYGLIPFVTIWWLTTFQPTSSQYQDMVCENQAASRHGRKMTEPGPECDLSSRNWCSVKTANYPEDKIMEIILDNRGIMKRLFGDNREPRFLESSIDNHLDEAPSRPPPRFIPRRKQSSGRKNVAASQNVQETSATDFDAGIQNGRFPNSDILAASSARHGKKIDSDDPREMKVIIVDAFLDEQKLDKNSDDYDPKLSQTKTFETAPSRFNDKVYTKTFDLPVRTLTMTVPTPDSDVTETTETTVFESTTTSEDLSTIEFQEIFDDITIETESPEVEDPVKAQELTTEATVETTKKEDVLESRTEISVSDSSKNIPTTTAVPLDSEDDLRYTTPQTTAAPTTVTTEKPPPAQNSFRSGLPPRTRPSRPANRRQPPKEVVEARVEPPSRFAPTQNNPGNQYGNPTSSVAQSFLRQPSQPLKRDPIIERPSSPLLEDRPSNGGPYQMEKFPACNSTSEVIAPTWAKSIQGKNLIVVNVGSFMQHLHVEECEKSSLYRKMYCQRGCRCEQQYRLQKLLVIDPDDECRGIFSDWFRFPSCCVCVCYPASMSRGGRSFNGGMEEEEEYWEDDDYFDDPFVSHYYGLDDDFEDNFEVEPIRETQAPTSSRKFEDDLQVSASSSSQTYKSYTDIGSIDRSFTREIPEVVEDENRKTSSMNLNNLDTNLGARNFSSYLGASRDKKSRLMAGFQGIKNLTMNIRPQVAPRRTPPARVNLPPNYASPWVRPPRTLSSLWPALASFNQVPPVNHYANPPQNIYYPDKIWAVTPSPPVAQEPTLGTLNAATQPYYKWNRRPRNLGEFQDTPTIQEQKSNVLTRIPR